MHIERLFEPLSLNGMILPNRFVRSATWEAMALPDGCCSDDLVQTMERLALGGVGMIVTGHAFISPEGAVPRQLGMHSDALISGLARMVDASRKAGSKIVAQLSHAGFHAYPSDPGQDILLPSRVTSDRGRSVREMSTEDIRKTVEKFGNASARAKKAGFDGVQVHAAHGYLLSQFLSPYYNKRTDSYGGNVENRARILLETIREIRTRVGKGYPVLIKINSEDFTEPGLCVGELLEIAELSQSAGIDCIEVSGGLLAADKRQGPVRVSYRTGDDGRGYFEDASCRLKKRLHIPVILVGGIRSVETATRILEQGIADLVAMSRPLIAEPGLVGRWKNGDLSPSVCRSDNLCIRNLRLGRPFRCLGIT